MATPSMAHERAHVADLARYTKTQQADLLARRQMRGALVHEIRALQDKAGEHDCRAGLSAAPLYALLG